MKATTIQTVAIVLGLMMFANTAMAQGKPVWGKDANGNPVITGYQQAPAPAKTATTPAPQTAKATPQAPAQPAQPAPADPGHWVFETSTGMIHLVQNGKVVQSQQLVQPTQAAQGQPAQQVQSVGPVNQRGTNQLERELTKEEIRARRLQNDRAQLGNERVAMHNDSEEMRNVIDQKQVAYQDRIIEERKAAGTFNKINQGVTVVENIGQVALSLYGAGKAIEGGGNPLAALPFLAMDRSAPRTSQKFINQMQQIHAGPNARLKSDGYGTGYTGRIPGNFAGMHWREVRAIQLDTHGGWETGTVWRAPRDSGGPRRREIH